MEQRSQELQLGSDLSLENPGGTKPNEGKSDWIVPA
jgi:hypothetical protein